MSLATKFGQRHVAEPFHNFQFFHHHKPEIKLNTVDWEPKNAVLDQEDLIEQGIDTAQIVKGAAKVDALGSCTANATASALSNVLSQNRYLQVMRASSYTDTKDIEIWAIKFYHLCTDETGETSSEWPPNDCGSSGPYIVQELQGLGLVNGQKIANGADNIVSLMQTGGLLIGSPWFNAWMEPGSNGFIDGKGGPDALEKAIDSGVAGGHETYWCALESVSLNPNGTVDGQNTVIRARNSWTKSWGDNGDYRVHLSTFEGILGQCDFRQLVG